MRKRTAAASVFFVLVAIALFACIERDRLCVSTTECGTMSACVAGRCQPQLKDDAGRPLPPMIASPQVRRLVVAPTDIAYVSTGGGETPSDLPPVLVLGKKGDGATLFLRFAVPIAPEENVVEAYVLLDRAAVVQSDPEPISLHADRIIDAWDGRSISYARQPRYEETASPATIVTGAGRPLVRIDVRDLATHWKMRDPRDQGIAIVADDTSRTGMSFAAASSVRDEGPTSMLGNATDEPSGTSGTWVSSPPRLELYLRTVPHDAHLNLPPPVASNTVTDGGKSDASKPDASARKQGDWR
jgi:hypothetical protein